TVNLTAANDTPALATPTAVAYTDTSADDTFGNTTGTLAGSDRDSGQTLTYGIDAGTTSGDGLTVSKTGTYGTLTVTKASGAYTFAPSDAAIEGVKTDVSENFTVTVSDGVVTTPTSATLGVNITGANDSAAFGGTTTGSVTEDGTATATGTVTFTDRDTADTAGAITAQTDTAGTYGSFSIGTNGAWTYTLNNAAAAVQNLNAGDAPTDVFSVAANGSSQSVTIAVNGANEAGTTPPTLVAPTATSGSLSFTDTAADNTYSSAGGTHSVSSWGGAATSGTFGISGGTVASGTSTKVGTYGTLTVNTTTGVWAFAPSDAGIEGIKTNTTEVFTVTANNGTATDTDTITISLTGADDTTSVSGTTGSATESATSTAAATVTGTLVVSDRDVADAAVIAAQTATTGTYGSFTIAASGAWTYTLDNADVDTQRLVAADSVTDSFNVDVGGGNTRAVRITITGINDAPSLSNTSISYNNTTSTSETFNNTTGTLPGADVDAGQTLTYGITGGTVASGVATKAGSYGTLSVNTTTGAYTYDPNDTAINAISTSASDSFDVTLSDGVASSATAATFVASIASGKTVGVLAYAWKTHTLLDGVNVGFTGVTAQNTASGGAASFSNVSANTFDLTASLTADSNTSSAVNLQDAIAILKMIVGLDVNGTGRALSPYQAFAADFDGDNTVGLTDAIGVLKHIVGLPAASPAWVFVNASHTSVPAMASGLSGKTLPTLSADVTTDTSVGLVGILRGDVDGSWAAPQGSQDLDTTQASYFTDLVTSLNVASPGTFNASQWGIYA
ncbi:MAG: hypothetical protein HZC24_10305, partial [Rhodocyclales bacterium]|nr:hypothetical protein [Rhodocyclales bacterium]